MAVAMTSLLAASSLVFGMTVSAAYAEPTAMTGNVALANPQLPSEAENAGKPPDTPVSRTSELVQGGVNPPRAVFLITGGILFIAGSGLLLLRRRQPYD